MTCSPGGDKHPIVRRFLFFFCNLSAELRGGTPHYSACFGLTCKYRRVRKIEEVVLFSGCDGIEIIACKFDVCPAKLHSSFKDSDATREPGLSQDEALACAGECVFFQTHTCPICFCLSFPSTRVCVFSRSSGCAGVLLPSLLGTESSETKVFVKVWRLFGAADSFQTVCVFKPRQQPDLLIFRILYQTLLTGLNCDLSFTEPLVCC